MSSKVYPVGRLIEFCCYLRRGNAGCNAQDRSNYMCAYERRDTYEYVKFILYLQDSYDESFVFFGKCGRNSRSISSSATKQYWEQQYYLVGTINVLRAPDKSVEIVGFRPANWKKPFEVIQIRTSSESSISTCISEDASTSTSISSTEIRETVMISSVLPFSGPTFGQGSMTELKYMQEPVDIEFEVDPEFLLSDSQDEQGSSEQGKCSDVDMKKLLEEAKASNLKEHVIDECSVPLNAPSDNDYCEVIEIIEDQKEPEVKELVVEQEQEKAPETSLKFPSTTAPCVRLEALVEPVPRRSFQFQRPLLGERFAQLSGPRVRTQVYDLNISRTFHDESSSYEDIQQEEREREQRVYELSQRIEMFRNLLPEPQQTGQGQDYPIYRPRDQVVTVIDDVGPHHINLFGNDNSEYPQNETDRVLLLTKEKAVHTFCSLVKKILGIFRLKETPTLAHEGKMR
ncbi:uncharacterized protein LOC129678078 [Psammomys obesus]|uniref:uncharacterized protein LOC129678078 n=1 Tax=Psammomys obesus TaxID=48139 RepID=UPI002452F261|nr:uncharacterized protein LOC129678078 [Psammomys obesus]